MLIILTNIYFVQKLPFTQVKNYNEKYEFTQKCI